MSEQMSKIVQEYLTKLLSAIESGATFTAEQVPIIIQEKLAFDFWWAVAGLILGILLWLLYPRLWTSTANIDDEDRGAVRFAGSAVITLVSGSLIIANSYNLLFILMAPRLYIIEWLRGML